jgi:filamentous hemagglutinin family protein
MNRSRAHVRPTRFSLRPIAAALISAGIAGAALAGPQGGVVRAGVASITGAGPQTRIQQSSDRAVIDWRSFGIGAAEQVLFQQPSVRSATLNRVTGDQTSVLLGRLDANGQVFLVNPNGIVIGRGAQINVGSLIASTSNVSNSNFMQGRLVFDQPGRPGAGIVNSGSITAAEGGLIALVAPHVRNDGLLQARLGRVVLGAADTFTIDLYGDALIHLALSDAHVGQLRDADGGTVASLITQAGQVDVAGGRAVLVTAATAKNVLDSLINMSGTIKADAAVAQGGRILLLGEGGKVDVSGTLSARGATGGTIEVLGSEVKLAATAALDASGASGGGTIHVGGAFQGGGSTYRAANTTVESGAALKANATERGDGGEVVVWSDGSTVFAGDLQAKGGPGGGNGGRMEASGKGTLAFLGTADASAPSGTAGSLLLDPAILDIGLAEAGLISRVLRTGTSTSLAADIDINVNSLIDGRGRLAGGGLTMTAGNNVNVNDFVLTNNGAINLFATAGTVNVAPGKAVFAGTAPITVRTGGTLHTGPLLTGGALSLTSTAGGVAIDTFIDAGTGPVAISAAGDVDINQPIVNLVSGNPLNVAAGNDINVNAQIDGRGGVAGGAVTLTAGNHLRLFDHITTNDGAINLSTITGSVFLAPVAQDANLLIIAPPKQVRAGSAPITIVSGGDFSNGAPPPQPIPTPPPDVDTVAEAKDYVREFLLQYVQLVTTGPLNITSTNGNVNVIAPISDLTGPVTITAGNAISVKHKINSNNEPITLNGGSGGITIIGVNDSCGINECFRTSPVDARMANLTLNSIGDVSITGGGVATAKTLIIDTRTRILTGSVGATSDSDRPSKVVLIADQGIPSFNVGKAGDVSATSIAGSINLDVFAPSKLRITTGTPDPNQPTAATDCTLCDISSRGLLGPDVVLNAGGSINLSNFRGDDTVTLIARAGDVNINQAIVDNLFTISAGRDVRMNAAGCSTFGPLGEHCGLVRVGPTPNVSATSGPLSVSAGRDIMTDAFSPIHVSNGQAFTLAAGRNVALSLLESLGPVSITASTGSITLNNPIGPHIANNTGGADFNPADKGVASLTMSAPVGPVTVTGARAEGDVTISTGGNLTSSAWDIVSVSGTRTITAASSSIPNNNSIGTQDQLFLRLLTTGIVVVPPGPTAAGLASVPAPGLPTLSEIAVSPASPAGSSDTGTVDASSAQRAARQGSTGDGETDGDSALVTLASSESEATAQQSVLCPAGVAPGSSLKRKDTAGREVTVTCK